VIFWRSLLGVLIAALVLGLTTWVLFFRDISQPHIADPVDLFNHGSIGNERAQGLPYWIWRVLPEVFPEKLPQTPENTKGRWTALGVHWPEGQDLPVGFSQKTLGVIPRVAPNCAICHQGVYRLNPEDQTRLVTAGPGTQVDIQAFTDFLFSAANDPRFTADEIMPAIEKYEELPLWESLIYRYGLIPLTKLALTQQAKDFEWTQKNPEWGIGRIDPFNPIKYGILELEVDGTIGNSDIMPLWNLQLAKAEGESRRSVHWDGLLTDVHETVVAGAIGDGMTYQSFPQAKDNLDRMETFINREVPPESPFRSDLSPTDPFFVSQADVATGKTIYTNQCAQCHEPSGARFRQPILHKEVKTDRHRLDMWTEEAKDKYSNYQSFQWDFKYFEKTDGYVSVDLTGLWLRGPYLHNGSVPNLRALLMSPDQRPEQFMRGSDLVDAANGGFVSRAELDPESRHWPVDTSIRGNGNQGHLWGTDLDEQEKDALLAYLKTR